MSEWITMLGARTREESHKLQPWEIIDRGLKKKKNQKQKQRKIVRSEIKRKREMACPRLSTSAEWVPSWERDHPWGERVKERNKHHPLTNPFTETF